MHFLFIFPTGSGFQASSTDSPSRTVVPALLPNESVPIHWFTALGMVAAALAQPGTDKATGTGWNPWVPLPGGASLPPCSSTPQIPAVCRKSSPPSKASVCSSAGSHKQTQGRKTGTALTGQGEAEPRAPQTPATMRLGAGKPGCFKRLKSWQPPPAFQGAAVSADSLCKTFICRKKKPKKFTVCCSVPNKDGKQALWAEQLFEPRYHLSPHLNLHTPDCKSRDCL